MRSVNAWRTSKPIARALIHLPTILTPIVMNRVCLFVLLAFAPPVFAQAPTTMAYQGLLTDASDVPVPDGSYSVTLGLFTAASGGSAAYAETHTVSTSGGVFSAELGAGAPVSGIWAALDFTDSYWLETDVAGTTLAPRTRLLASPYARTLAAPASMSTSATNSVALTISNAATSGYGDGLYVFGAEGTNSWAIYGATPSELGTGVRGIAGGTVGTSYGVWGGSGSDAGNGVYGLATHPNGFLAYGVYGESLSSEGTGVRGLAPGVGVSGTSTADTGLGYGVEGFSNAPDGAGVRGSALHLTGTTYGVYGNAFSPNGYAGFFDGRVNVTGTLTKGGGAFQIDHPLDPENRILRHSFVESPDMMNVYNGNVTTDTRGYATVELPAWFEALNRDFRYQLTVLGQTFAQAIVTQEVRGNRFVILTNEPHTRVSWQVTGIRQDAWANENRIVVEEDKKPDVRGRYLHPAAFGFPRERSVDYSAEAEARLEEIKIQEAARSAEAARLATERPTPTPIHRRDR